MNIKEAKIQIQNAIKAYRTKDEFGRQIISKQRQRPLFLVGAPGIGKTAIVEQVAKELGLPLVSYSITHHTRQSALGLPYICEKEYHGKTFRISEYTMSEIIASVYKKMNDTGLEEGILFLDEINCVSETLTPAMLQFLQYKVFGQHQVPDGWIVITAGNPPEYNSSVHEFDMVTQDRLKKIDIEPDYQVWKEWAVNENIHPSILSYLDICKDDFYKVENNIEGKSFVTPRGWVDLSDMMNLYEINQIDIDELLIHQYLQNDKIAKHFSSYYELWHKYQEDYKIQNILNGKVQEEILLRAQNASFDERISLIGLLLDQIKSSMKIVMNKRRTLISIKNILKETQQSTNINIKDHIDNVILSYNEKINETKKELLVKDEEDHILTIIKYLEKINNHLSNSMSREESQKVLKKYYQEDLDKLKNMSNQCSSQLENLFKFIELAYHEGAEMLIVITELTSSKVSARYIGQYGSESYYRYNQELLFYERSQEVLKEIDDLL